LSLQQIRRDIEGLKESTKARHVQVLLTCKGEDLTDAELTKLLMEVPIRQLPTSVLLTIQNRAHGNNFKCLQYLPAGYLEKMRNEYWESLTETEKKNLFETRRNKEENNKGVWENEPAAIEKRTNRA